MEIISSCNTNTAGLSLSRTSHAHAAVTYDAVTHSDEGVVDDVISAYFELEIRVGLLALDHAVEGREAALAVHSYPVVVVQSLVLGDHIEDEGAGLERKLGFRVDLKEGEIFVHLHHLVQRLVNEVLKGDEGFYAI